MSELLTAVITGASTGFVGVLVFVLGQIVLKFFIEPLQEYKEVRGEVSYALLFYANVYGELDPPEVMEEARKHLRGLAGKLRVCLHKIPCYSGFDVLGRVSKREALIRASTELVGWSESLPIA
jgi:hypothetical protein